MIKVIVLPAEVIKVEAAWKIKTAFASPWASSVSAPELAKVPEPFEYAPGVITCDASSADARTVGVGALMSLKAVTRSVCAVVATGSAMCCTPEVVTLELPVKADPGASPISPPADPLITVGPVFVIVVAARTAKLVVVPGVIVGVAADVVVGYMNIASNGNVTIAVISLTFSPFFILNRFCCVSSERHKWLWRLTLFTTPNVEASQLIPPYMALRFEPVRDLGLPPVWPSILFCYRICKSLVGQIFCATGPP